MTDKLETQASAGRQAKSLMEQEPIRKAFTDLEAEYIQAWSGTSLNDMNARERLWSAVQILGDVKRHLSQMLPCPLSERWYFDVAAAILEAPHALVRAEALDVIDGRVARGVGHAEIDLAVRVGRQA